MTEPVISSVVVKYQENNQTKSREVKFKGNFGMNIDGKQYHTQNGRLFDSNGKAVTELDLPKGTAYQFIGMSCTAESARDYTYSEKDIKQAEYDQARQHYEYRTQNGLPYPDVRTTNIIGTGAGGAVVPNSTTCENGVYSTQYRESSGYVSKVSIWMQN